MTLHLTRRDVALEQRLQRAHRGVNKAIADGNGLLAARDIGILGDLQPIRFEDPFTLSCRVVQAKVASEHFGVAMINPILPAEAEHIGQQIESATADNLMGMLSGLRNGLVRMGHSR